MVNYRMISQLQSIYHQHLKQMNQEFQHQQQERLNEQSKHHQVRKQKQQVIKIDVVQTQIHHANYHNY